VEGGLAATLVSSTVALGVVCLLALAALRALRRRDRPRGLRVITRLQLEPRRSLYVVEAAGRWLLIGVGDGPMALVAELDPRQFAAAPDGADAGAENGVGGATDGVTGVGGSTTVSGATGARLPLGAAFAQALGRVVAGARFGAGHEGR
jgi:flagellar biogenesis protein FliO